MKTLIPNEKNIIHKWLLIDAKNKILGRLASKVAMILRGKHKNDFIPHIDTGDYIIIINSYYINLTGKKSKNKNYFRHTNYPGGIKKINFENSQYYFPTRAIRMAIKGMLPKGPLGYKMLKKLKVYPKSNHPHMAQLPKLIET